jgi:hypothetical protein
MSNLYSVQFRFLDLVSILSKYDGFVKSPKTPSPLTGEGWGEGKDLRHFNYFGSPSPSSPPAKGGEF